MFSEEILAEIELTLDRLIENASAMKDISLLKEEVEAFQKTQQSLLEHLMHLDEQLQQKRKMIKISNYEERKKIINQKFSHFQNLNTNFIKKASEKIRLIKRCKKAKN